MLSAVPFPLYAVFVRPLVGSVLGGVGLAALPAVAYGDFFFGGEDGVSFAFLSIPLLNFMVLAAVILLNQLVMRVEQSPAVQHSVSGLRAQVLPALVGMALAAVGVLVALLMMRLW